MSQTSQASPSLEAHAPDIAGAHADAIASIDQHELRIERWILLYMVGFILVLTTAIARATNLAPREVAYLPGALGALMLAAPLFWAAARDLWEGRASSWILASLAVLAALAIDDYVMAGLLAFLLLLFDQVVRRTAWGARKAIQQLVRLTPSVARVVDKDGAEREAPLSEIAPGMIVRVRPGENLPVDGDIVAGQTTINQAILTGESMPVEAQVGDGVYAGAANLTGIIDLKVTSVGADTTIGKVSELIQAAESARSPRQQMIEQVSAYFIPAALAIAGLVWYFYSQSGVPNAADIATRRAIAVLLVAFPQALILATPTAMVAAFTAAARLGILVKQGQHLETASNIDTVVFDKTGTLTTGVFEVSRLAPVEGVDPADLLKAAATGEQHSNHPLARSIMETAHKARIEPDDAPEFTEVHGRGVRAKVNGEEVLVGRGAWLLEQSSAIGADVGAVEKQIEGMTGVHVMRGGRYLGAVGLEDQLRPSAKAVVERLRALGVKRVSMFTGDRTGVAIRVGKAVGVDHIESECLPEEKHQRLRAMMQAGRRALFVGDGINDGPCLAAADVGVAMGLSGSDIATNSAGVALMNDDLSRVPFLIDLSRRTRGVLTQNISASFAMVIAGLGLAATGQLSVFAALAYHLVGDVIVALNSFRLVRFGEESAHTERGSTITRREATVSLRPQLTP